MPTANLQQNDESSTNAEAVRTVRRKKIRQLEATLFHQNDDDGMGEMQQQQQDAGVGSRSRARPHPKRSRTAKALKRQAKEVKNMLFPYSRLRAAAEDDVDSFTDISSIGAARPPPHHHSKKTPMTKSLLQKEVEELDHSMRRLALASKTEGMSRRGSTGSASSSSPWSAALLSQGRSMGSSSFPTHDRAVKLLSDEQARLDLALSSSYPISTSRQDESIGAAHRTKIRQISEQQQQTRRKLTHLDASGVSNPNLIAPAVLPAISKQTINASNNSSSSSISSSNNNNNNNNNNRLAAKNQVYQRVRTPASRDSPDGEGMISFDGLERPYSSGPRDIFHNIANNSNYHGMPDVYRDLPSETFANIPSDIFDAIPIAVSEREVRKMERRQETYNRQRGRSEGRQIQQQQNEGAAALIYLAQREAGNGGGGGGGGQQVMRPRDSLMSSLFSTTPAAAGGDQ